MDEITKGYYLMFSLLISTVLFWYCIFINAGQILVNFCLLNMGILSIFLVKIGFEIVGY